MEFRRFFEFLYFANRVRRPFKKRTPADLPQAILDVRGLESLRRAMAAAVRGFDYAHEVVSETQSPRKPASSALTNPVATPVGLSTFIDEVERALNSQSLLLTSANRVGMWDIFVDNHCAWAWFLFVCVSFF